MNQFESEQIYYTDQNLVQEVDQQMQLNNKNFQKFIKEYNFRNVFTYREQLINNHANSNYNLQIDLEDLKSYNEQLSQLVREKPIELIPILEQAIKELAMEMFGSKNDYQIMIISNENPKPLRDLKAPQINKLVTVNGIVINSTKIIHKATNISVICKNCQNIKILDVQRGIGGSYLPRYCDSVNQPGQQREKCPLDPYVVLPEKSVIIDQQILKFQENPENVPTGEIPRTFSITIDGCNAGKLVTGARIVVTGIYQVVEQKVVSAAGKTGGLKLPFIRVLGFQIDKSSNRKIEYFFSQEDEEKFKKLSQDPKIYEKIYKSVANTIYGHDDVKKAIACLLFSGSRKVLRDKTKLRGDINVLLIGDPSTAKSQFLKFVERTAPIAVYTSGKGSSAAGLTASIIKDPNTGEFGIEGGAMVLADGGVVCIDEFDKMNAYDRIAIHEAMEQQTISVAKAGITTILNSRTSVLAAANPIYGRYHDNQTLSDQIDLQTTILSRFDCIFIVRDTRTENHDLFMANHIINLHQGQIQNQGQDAEIDLDFLKKYIYYAKTKISPRLNDEAAQMIQQLYCEDRKKASEQKNNQSKKGHIPITIRQLEAIIRISEAMAKMGLEQTVSVKHVEEAHNLFQKSTMNAISCGLQSGESMTSDQVAKIQKIEEAIRRRMSVSSKIQFEKLRDELVQRFNNNALVEKAINNMTKSYELKFQDGGKILSRIK